MSEQGISPCQQFDMFHHIFEESPRPQRSRSPGYAFARDDCQPKPAHSLDALFVASAVQKLLVNGGATPASCEQYATAFEANLEAGSKQVCDAVSDRTTLLKHLQRPVARDFLAFERMKKLY
ncbi:hypothetical protein PG985_008527 [Apiospora marii]|uniref:uncharacterized protein n=1 Tax=Apiospora marii TaxID=335849 RepID=UPI00312DA627